MNENKIEYYNKMMALHFPKAIGAVSWWWRIITLSDISALIHEEELHSAFEHAKNFYKKQFELDDELSDKQKELFKKACDADLSGAEHIAKQFELEEVSPHVYRYKEPYTEFYPMPQWAQYVFEKYMRPVLDKTNIN